MAHVGGFSHLWAERASDAILSPSLGRTVSWTSRDGHKNYVSQDSPSNSLPELRDLLLVQMTLQGFCGAQASKNILTPGKKRKRRKKNVLKKETIPGKPHWPDVSPTLADRQSAADCAGSQCSWPKAWASAHGAQMEDDVT